MSRALRVARTAGIVAGAVVGGAVLVLWMWFLIRMNF